MRAWRFSLIGLLGAVTFAAVACGALISSSERWSVGIATATTALLSYAVLAAIYRTASRRAFWLGLTVIGWGYFLLPGFALGFQFENYGKLPLASAKLLEWLGDKRLNGPAQTMAGQGVNSNAGLNGSVAVDFAFPVSNSAFTFSTTGPGSLTLVTAGGVDEQTWARFYTIGHCLWSLLFGLLGALVASRLDLARRRRID
jgi:hypothetical protein